MITAMPKVYAICSVCREALVTLDVEKWSPLTKERVVCDECKKAPTAPETPPLGAGLPPSASPQSGAEE